MILVVPWFPLFRIASVQHSLGLLIWGGSSPSIYHGIENMGILYGGGWDKEGGWQGP